MSVVVDFSVPADDFPLGSAITSVGEVEVTLEAVVPTGGDRVPYVWVTGDDLATFERGARDAEGVAAVTRLDRVGEDALYRFEWSADADGLLAGLADHEAVVLDATLLHRWCFRVRFHHHDLLREFYESCRDEGVDLLVTRVSVLEETPPVPGATLDLTPRQREALLLAVRRGHFEVPRRTDLSDLATELGISRQATSTRIRRGVDNVLRATLLGSGGRGRP